MSVHSGALGMYTPYAYKKTNDVINPNPSVVSILEKGKAKMLEVLRDVNRDYCRCGVGAAAVELNYLCPGNCMDYAFDEWHVPYSFAFEIWDGRGYANAKTSALIEASAGDMIEKLTSETHDHHNHQHDHEEHEHEETETEQEESEKSEDELVALSTNEKITKSAAGFGALSPQGDAAPKPRRGHSCFNSVDTFASAELEGFVEIAAESTQAARQRFPAPKAGQVDQCLRQFNPTSPREYEETVEHWSNAFLNILNKLPSAESL